MNEKVLIWWDNLGANTLLTIIKQGELTEKYYGRRIPRSLKIEEITQMYQKENLVV